MKRTEFSRLLVLAAFGATGTFTAGCDSLDNPGRQVGGLAYSPRGDLEVFFGDGVALVTSDLSGGQFANAPAMPQQPHGFSAVSADGNHAMFTWFDSGATGYPDGTIVPPSDKPGIVVFRTADGIAERTFDGLIHQGAALSDHGETLVIGTSTNAYFAFMLADHDSVTAYRVSDGAQLWAQPYYLAGLTAVPGADAVAGISMAPANSTSVAPAILRVLDMKTGAERLSIELPCSTEANCGTMRIAPDGTAAVVSIMAAPFHHVVYSLADGSLLRDLPCPSGRIPTFDIAVSSGGAFVAALEAVVTSSGYSDADGIVVNGKTYMHEVVVWQGGNIALRRPGDFWGGEPSTIALSPDGSRLATSELDGLTLIAVPSGEVLARKNFKEDVF